MNQATVYELTEGDQTLIDFIDSGQKVPSFPLEARKYTELITGILFQFADSQMAGAAGYARFINLGPTIDDRRNLAMIAAEKMSMSQSTYALLGEQGLNVDKYFSSHCWESRMQRKASLGFRRAASDRRLNALIYPLENWADVAAFTYLMASMACLELEEFAGSSFEPWSELAEGYLPIERKHTHFGRMQMEKLASENEDRVALQLSIDYWFERVLTSFGPKQSTNNELCRAFKLKSKTNEELASTWVSEVAATCHSLHLKLTESGTGNVAACH